MIFSRPMQEEKLENDINVSINNFCKALYISKT